METEFDAEVQNYRNIIITYIINQCPSKLPIKASDIIEIVHKDKNLYTRCLPLAQNALKSSYGIIVEKVPRDKGGKGSEFICYSEVTAISSLEYNEDQRRDMTLLFLILSYIFMSGTAVDGSKIENFLNGLKIYYDEVHPYFGGNLKKRIAETFVKQLYLKHEKSKSELDLETKYLYSWGFRSELEFDKKKVLESAAKILGKPAESFVQQSEDIMRGEEVVEEEG